jgi:hypothetical protein
MKEKHKEKVKLPLGFLDAEEAKGSIPFAPTI